MFVPPSPPQDVCGELVVAEADVTRRASGDDLPRAVDEDQGSLLRCQNFGSLAVNVRQKAVVRLDDVRQRDRLRAPGAVYLHDALRRWAFPGRIMSRPGVRSPTIGRDALCVNRALNGVTRRR